MPLTQNRISNTTLISTLFLFGGSGVLLVAVSQYNYLLFHTLVELFSIIIAGGLFVIAWSTRDISDSPYLVNLGIAYLFIGLLDIFHTLSYKGMNIFTDYDFYANQVWVAARVIESLSILAALVSSRHKIRPPLPLLLTGYTLITALALASIFIWKIFPVCFVPGEGQTLFKIASEIFVMVILALALAHLLLANRELDDKVRRYFAWSILFTIASELAFTLYTGNYDYVNTTGHFLKVVSFYLIYKSIIETSIREPFTLIFQNLKQREQELENTASKLEEANRQKDTFFSIIAHDLKDDFNSLIGLTDMMHDDLETMDEPTRKSFIKHISNTSHRTYRFLTNLLDWARINTGRISTERKVITLGEIIDTVVSLYRERFEEKGLKLDIDVDRDQILFTDPFMISSVLRNLVSNALKYSFRGGRVRVYSSLDKEKNFLSITVKDNGKGMSNEQMRELFRIDRKVSMPGTEREKGTGLGLLVTREFVEFLGGVLLLDCKVDGGCEFTVRLPLASENIDSAS
jgi:signal transduction histidine kinase